MRRGNRTQEGVTNQVFGNSEECPNGRIADGFEKLGFDFFRDVAAHDILLFRVQRRQTHFRARPWDVDLVLGHMSCGCVVLGMADSPRMVWDAKTNTIS